jgi:hypothetical protein
MLLPEIWNFGSCNFDRYASDAEAAAGETATALATVARGKGAEESLIVSPWPFLGCVAPALLGWW